MIVVRNYEVRCDHAGCCRFVVLDGLQMPEGFLRDLVSHPENLAKYMPKEWLICGHAMVCPEHRSEEGWRRLKEWATCVAPPGFYLDYTSVGLP